MAESPSAYLNSGEVAVSLSDLRKTNDVALGDLKYLGGVSLCLVDVSVSKWSSAVKVNLCRESVKGEDQTSTPGQD